ncbi:MAG TPA: DUF131 domain-containing protein [Candidatus Acidoferrales bacterium]|nr:DUF131 domain-containing protein [Candidatus Acidoferrales bacterium]
MMLKDLLKATDDFQRVRGCNSEMDTGTLYGLGSTLILVGVIIMMIAILLMFFSNAKWKGKVKGGGAIIIGPVPIVFGTDKESLRTVLLLAIVLTVLLIVLTVAVHFLSE